METHTAQDVEEALRAIATMIGRSEAAQAKFTPGTAQHTLQKNRIRALQLAAALIAAEGGAAPRFTKEELEKARAPIASLISKSEKAQAKLAQGTWQHAMLEANLKALRIALPLFKE